MNIQQLSDNRVMISMCNEDMKNFKLSFDSIDFKNPDSQKILKRLVDLACKSNCLITKNKSILLEAVPYCDGCVFLISIGDKKTHKRYKVKKIKEYPCYKFFSCDELFDAIKILYQSKLLFYSNSVYLLNDAYYLVFDYPLLSIKAQAILCEYSKKLSATKVFLSRLQESATTISYGNAITNIGSRI